jgi:hypothetical protein
MVTSCVRGAADPNSIPLLSVGAPDRQDLSSIVAILSSRSARLSEFASPNETHVLID